MPSRTGTLPDNLPYLVLLHGPGERRPRVLDRDVSTIGRARGCDLCLEASDVSTIHCILYRAGRGYFVRDCNSRTGTRVNGDTVRAPRALVDTDVLQIGPFSFEVHVPRRLSTPDLAIPDPAQLVRYQESRRRLAGHALRLRRLVHAVSNGVSARAIELQQELARVEEKSRTYERRLQELNEADRELEDDRERLQKRIAQVENDIARRLDEAELEIRTRWLEFQRRCQDETTRLDHPDLGAATTNATDAAAQEPAAREHGAHLHAAHERAAHERAAHERAAHERAAHERAAHERVLAEREQRIAQQLQGLHAQRQEFDRMKQQTGQAQTESAAAFDRQRAALAQQETAVRAQRAELARMLGELKALQDELRRPYQDQLTALGAENEQLCKTAADLEVRLAQSALHSASPRELKESRAENELLRMLLKDRERELANAVDQLRAAPKPDVSAAPVIEALRGENEHLQAQLAEQAALVADLRIKAAPKPQKAASELESYEAELNQERQQLEKERAKMASEMESLRVRNQDLDEATRELEMELSRERAELARERTRMERMREELKADMEKMQREMSVRESLASVNRLRDELKKSGPKSEPIGRIRQQLGGHDTPRA